jgi:hypothetical protein
MPKPRFYAGFFERFSRSRDRESAIAFVCRLMHLHQLPAVRVGPHWRFNHDSVDRWCDGRLARPR